MVEWWHDGWLVGQFQNRWDAEWCVEMVYRDEADFSGRERRTRSSGSSRREAEQRRGRGPAADSFALQPDFADNHSARRTPAWERRPINFEVDSYGVVSERRRGHLLLESKLARSIIVPRGKGNAVYSAVQIHRFLAARKVFRNHEAEHEYRAFFGCSKRMCHDDPELLTSP